MPATPKAALTQELNATSESFLRSLEGIPDGRWAWTPSPDIWSVAQTAEHTTAVFRNIQKLLTTTLTDRPLPAGTRTAIADDFIVKAMFDRSRRLESPAFVLPKGRWANPGELIAAYTTSQQELVRWLTESTIDLRGYSADHVRLGPMDGVQWVIFVAAHTERHTRQILEFREGNGF